MHVLDTTIVRWSTNLGSCWRFSRRYDVCHSSQPARKTQLTHRGWLSIITGNLAAAVARWSRDHNGPEIAFQWLTYPVTDYNAAFDDSRFKSLYMLKQNQMKSFWKLYLPNIEDSRNPYANLLAVRARVPQIMQTNNPITSSINYPSRNQTWYFHHI